MTFSFSAQPGSSANSPHSIWRSMLPRACGSRWPAAAAPNSRQSAPVWERVRSRGIEKKAVLLGMGDKFELWSEQAHHEQIRQTLGDADLGEDLLDLAL